MSCTYSSSRVCDAPGGTIAEDRLAALSGRIKAVYDECEAELPSSLRVSVKSLLPQNKDDVAHSVAVVGHLAGANLCSQMAEDIECLQQYTEYVNTYDWRVAHSVMRGEALTSEMNAGLQSVLCGREDDRHALRTAPSLALVIVLVAASLVAALLLYTVAKRSFHAMHLRHGHPAPTPYRD